MTLAQARALVADTLTAAFARDRFRLFAINLLNHVDESTACQWNATNVKDAFKVHVARYERLGTFTSPERERVDILVVHVVDASTLVRTRTALRNFVADHLSRDSKDAALVAFVSPTEAQWRLSFITMEYAAEAKDDGRVVVRTKLTPARRRSYIVGEGESCHTAQRQFVPLLQETDQRPTLAALSNAFSVEAVTKEFFEQYKELFLALTEAIASILETDKPIRADFTKKHVVTADFAKKLLGQIVFLSFLQKKGWLGVPKSQPWGTGTRTFLRELFGGGFTRYTNFFNDVLEPLFYDTLATDRGHDAWCQKFRCRIPFLNGGLFEPLGEYDWRGTDLLIPNALFSNTNLTKAGDVGTGILDVFDRYNFTVNEAEPLEVDVAIDPEMLGKIFENLLGVKERASKGSFYTPRAIVHYMCQESLVNYLDTALNTDRNTSSQKRAAARQELVSRADLSTFIYAGDQASHYELARVEGTQYARSLPKSIQINARLIDEALESIAVCDPAIGSGAFPVGMMQELVRARTVLTPYFNDVRERTAYHFKRHAIQQCLYGVDIDQGAVEIAKLRLWLSLVVDEEDVTQIKPLPNLDYKIVTGNSLGGVEADLFNVEALTELENLKPCFFDETDTESKHALRARIERLIHTLTRGKQEFDFAMYFSEVMDARRRGGFDVVIGNPPYVRQETIKALKPSLKARYECFTGTADLYVYFYEQGIRLLRPLGCLSYISSNSFLNAGFAKSLRAYLTTRASVLQVIDFAETHVFEAVTEPCIVLLLRGTTKDCETAFVKWDQRTKPERIRETFTQRVQHVRQDRLDQNGWQLESPDVLRLLDKLRATGRPLGACVRGRLYRGVLTGLNEAFVVDRATRDRLIHEHSSSAEVLKPFLRGRDVKRWQTTPKDLWLIFTRRGIDITKYPAIQNYLSAFKKKLMPGVPGGRKGGSYKWYEIQDNIAYWQEFEEPKIVYQEINRTTSFAYDTSGAFINNKLFMLPGAPIEWVGLMNSRLGKWYLHTLSGVPVGGFLALQKPLMDTFPIPSGSAETYRDLRRCVETMASYTPSAASHDTERRIDELVYALYDLTTEEIALVEANTP